jgi:hypothetical protein
MNKRLLQKQIALNSGPALNEAAINHHRHFLSIIAKSREKMNAGPIIRLLAIDAIYESQNIQFPLVGREKIGEYLKKRFDYFRLHNSGAPLVRILQGSVDLPSGKDHPCLIFTVAHKRQALWIIKLSEDNRSVARIDILTVFPNPDTARLHDNKIRNMGT